MDKTVTSKTAELAKLVAVKPFPWNRKAYKPGDPIEIDERVARMFVKGKLAITEDEAKKRGIKTGVKTPENLGGQRQTPENVRPGIARRDSSVGSGQPYKRRDMQPEGSKKSED